MFLPGFLTRRPSAALLRLKAAELFTSFDGYVFGSAGSLNFA